MTELRFNEKDIVSEYLQGQSVLSLSNKYNCYTQKIQKVLDDNHIEKISRAKRMNMGLKEDYFENIDSANKAYWLGWLLTDGGVSQKNGIEIALKKEDAYILFMFESDLGISGHVKSFGNLYARFSLSCVSMISSLKQYGIVPNKTLTLKFPHNIPNEFENHLLRGMFDGDGGFTLGVATRYYKNRGKSYTKPYREFSFTGTKDMCEGFQDVLLRYINIPAKNISANHSICRIRWSNIEEILQICNFLYTDAGEHYLIRKYDLYQSLLYDRR